MSAATEEAERRWPNPTPELRSLNDEAFEHADTRYGFEQGVRWFAEQLRREAFHTRAEMVDRIYSNDVNQIKAQGFNALDRMIAAACGSLPPEEK